MKRVILLLIGSIFLVFVTELRADEISLIEKDDLPKTVSRITPAVTNQEEVATENEETPDEQESQQIDDFIQKENEKLKDIKLLNLDLERSSLELKKREIEQKITQINKSEDPLPISNHENATEVKLIKPTLKLLGIFESMGKKQALLNINGTNMNVKEGQNINGMIVKSINQQGVVMEYEDESSLQLNLS